MASFLGKSVIIVDKVKKTNQTSFCQNCDLVFGNEDLCKVHSCLAIKQENPDVIDFGKNAQDITNENFKIENQTAQHFQNLDSADPLHVENLGMLTKRDLYDALSAIFPTGQSILNDRKEYSCAVNNCLRQKFGPKISELDLNKFSKNYTDRICALLKKHHIRPQRMLTSKAHVVFFNKIISCDTLSSSKHDSGQTTQPQTMQPILKDQTQIVSTLNNHGLKRKFEEYEATAEEIKEIEKMLDSKAKKPKIMKIVKTVFKPIKSQNNVHQKKSEDSVTEKRTGPNKCNNQFKCNPEWKEKYDKMLSNESILQIFKHVGDICKTIVELDPYSARAKHIRDAIKETVDCYGDILMDRQNGVSVNDESENIESEDVGSENVKSENVESENVESENVESENLESENLESENLESENFQYHDEIGIECNSKEYLDDSKVLKKKSKELQGLEEKKKEGGKRKSINNENIKPNNNRSGRRNKSRKNSIDAKFELVKNQCGRHSIASMARMLDTHSGRLKLKIREEGIIFSKKLLECQLCEIKRNTIDLKSDTLLPFLRFDNSKKIFECSICSFSGATRDYLYTHIRSEHGKEIVAKVLPDTVPENTQECNGSVCKRVYGSFGTSKRFWCKKCSDKLQLDEKIKKELKAGMCSQCGLSVQDLTSHYYYRHFHKEEKHNCNICSLAYPSLQNLDKHKKAVHEKVPCTQCGKLFGGRYLMKRHTQSAHTPDDQKKYKCDTCGKGFTNNQRLSEHLNVHTGEKPFKCKFCPACFASKGTLAMHERGHVGRGRINHK